MLVNQAKFRYCPACGGESLRFDGVKRFHCESCDFVFYFNPAAAVAGIITEGDRVLAGVRAFDPKQGYYDFPGGFVDPGESAEQALLRELAEELGQSPHSISYLCSSHNVYHYRGLDYTICDVFYRCEYADLSVLKAADDVAELRWLPIAELDCADFAFDSASDAIRHIQRSCLHGD